MMKKIFLAMLMACFLIIPARAEDTADQTGEGMTSDQEDRVVVTTLDELKAAIATANDGDTIELAQTIQMIDESISTDKNITILCAENFEGQKMFDVRRSTVIGLHFNGSGVDCIFSVISSPQQETIIRNCTFDGGNTSKAISIYSTTEDNVVRIIDCEFKNCFGSAINARASTDIVMERCYVHETYAVDASGAVDSSGKVTLNDCIITGNSSFANAGVRCSGALIISGGQIRANTIKSTEHGAAVDVFCSGIWSITNEPTEDAGYYDTVTGEKLSLPIYESDVLTRLVYLKDEDAKEFFPFLFEPDTGEGDESNIPELPQESTQTPEGDGEGNQPETDSQEPIAPPASSEEDDAPEQTPEQPIDPPLDDNITVTEADVPQQPQEPVDSTHSYIPYWPSVRPTRPTVTTTTPTDESKIEPETPTPARKPLICNGVTIDTSKTIVLLGYGDGQLHEADSLTRAQLATVIYRLLDEQSTAMLRQTTRSFSDVDADAWYAPYVLALAEAGVVNGVGNGQYDPDSTVTMAQVLAVLERFVEPATYTLQYIHYDGWALQAVASAVGHGWITDSAEIDPDAPITRGFAAALINHVVAKYR